MTLTQRTILIIVSTFIALLFILATTSDLILLSSYSALEKADITSHTRHISNNIDDKLKQLDMSAREVAEHLKETGGVPPSSGRAARQLFPEMYMQSHGVDLAAFYDRAGLLAAVSAFDCKTNQPGPVTAGQKQALAGLVSRITPRENTVRGVVSIDGSPLMVAFKFVTGSNGKNLGVVAVGWYIDSVEMNRIFRASGSSITVYDLNSPLVPDVEKAAASIDGGGGVHVAVIDTESVAGYLMLTDVFGEPSFIVRAVEKRTLYEHGKATIAYIIMALFLAGGVICFVMLVFVRGTILTRLQSLTAKVRQITDTRDISERVPLSGHEDELQTLTVSINSMLESLESAEAGMRESEERYRMLFERAPDAIIIIGMEEDEAGQIVAANQAAADQHGYTLDELLSMRIQDLNSDETNKNTGAFLATIASGEWVTAEVWHRKKDGTQVPIEIHAGLIRIGGKRYVLGFDRDITQRKITEETDHMYVEQIRQLNDELSRKAIDLVAANNELETFNYSVSHDMRGPLTRISGYCQLLLEDVTTLEPDAREYVTRIYESETWLNEMIDALLHLAQVTRVEIVADRVDLSAIAEQTLKERSLEHPDRSVTTRIEPGIVVAGDSRLLKMVMINLLDNAWKYSALKNDAAIEFGVDRTGSEPVYYVRDNGAGFDMKGAGKLFRVFSRLHDTSQFAGTGIGLATIQRIIFRHGGRIWAEAAAGTGATFFFTLP